MRLILALALLLSACATVPPVSPPLSPASGTKTNGPAGAGLGGQVPSNGAPGSAVNTLTYNNGANTFSGVVKVQTSNQVFGQAQKADADGTSFQVIAFSDDGKTSQGSQNIISATIIGSSSNSAAGFGQYAVFRRDSTSVLPTSGSGQLVGLYRGVIGADGQALNGHTAGAQLAITGNATLTADFTNATISGTITNRRTLDAAGTASEIVFGTVTLGQSAIDGNGGFGAAATGGAATTLVDSTSNGRYDGLIGGTNGTGIAGALILRHAIGGVTFFELGVFTGTR